MFPTASPDNISDYPNHYNLSIYVVPVSVLIFDPSTKFHIRIVMSPLAEAINFSTGEN